MSALNDNLNLDDNSRDKRRRQSARALYLLITLGLRKMEVLSLRWENIDLEKNTAFLADTKSGTPRHVILNSLALELLTEMASEIDDTNPWLFPSNSSSGHLTEIRKTFESITEQAEIDDFRIHDLRRSFASNLINAGVSIYEIRDLLGHADVRTTQIYAHLDKESLQTASEISAQVLTEALKP
jgi:integrase